MGDVGWQPKTFVASGSASALASEPQNQHRPGFFRWLLQGGQSKPTPAWSDRRRRGDRRLYHLGLPRPVHHVDRPRSSSSAAGSAAAVQLWFGWQTAGDDGWPLHSNMIRRKAELQHADLAAEPELLTEW
jgi:hypothetical protein